MNEVKRLARQLPVHKLKMTPWDYVRYLPMSAGTFIKYVPKAICIALWERGKKILKYCGVEL